jgi:hypothetical protein
MHQIPACATAITLFSRSGNVWAYPTLNAALKALGRSWIAANVGAHFRVFRTMSRYLDTTREAWVYEPVYDVCDFIMRDDAGGVVTVASFPARAWRSRWNRLLDTWNGEGPVPGITCGRGRGHYYRRPHTMSERRQAALVLIEEGEVAPRPPRSASNLPNSWDDYRVSGREDRNWKRNRKTRWQA